MDIESLHHANERAWDLAATKYTPDVAQDVAFLRSGGNNLMEVERRLLGDLSWCRRAIHLQCSHGLDALSLWKLGAHEVVGIDISRVMLDLARRKSDLLGAPATWIHSNVLTPPVELNGSADLVYTGKGALCWVMDLARWAAVVARLLRPGGRFYVFEGHPLNWVWETEVAEHRLRADGDYFAEAPRTNQDFPAAAIARAVPAGEPPPPAIERQWPLGQVVTSLVQAGLVVEVLEEHPEHFWPQFDQMPQEIAGKLPKTFSLLMRKPAPA